ncbi:ribonuclease HII [Brumimicrobium salinarum]|uniref:Ribonuclease HII n=1 Tax=Brumimicrobium salinarum TaxID=2058658 RepID=A0A2I0R0F7_9FLAO|nr:ribonuclease HII [Brumimicrobium salinarum]PKR79870.1 ribonuclease HII [Brumimicrobium salinarum]
MSLQTFYTPDKIEAGCDEAGRGCIAGPVVAAAVILPKDCEIELLNDSKQLSAKKRQMLLPIIKSKAIAYAVSFVTHQRIDEINILNASFEAMHLAVDQLELKPELLLIDGNRFNPHPSIPHTCVVKGDAKFMSIAAASVLAKEARDAYMHKIHHEYPYFDWNTNMGYPTKKHKLAIKEHGISAYHRTTFKMT